MANAGEMIGNALIDAGVDHAFGMPGGGTTDIFHALYEKQDKFKVILVRHEQTAACMADMYGRLARKPAVLLGQGPFISSSGSFGILEAYMSSSPMLVLTDTSDKEVYGQHGTYQSGTGEYGSFDIVGILRSISKYTTLATTPTEAVQGTQLAIKHATAGRPGPACVVSRNNAFAREIDPESTPRIYPTQGYLSASPTIPPRENVAKVVDLLLESRKPVIIAGNGVHTSRAYQELRELAELLGIPVATSYKGKSAIPEVHPLALGVMGTFGQKVANSVIAEADLLLVAGCHLAPSDTKYESLEMINPARQKIVQIDIEPRNAGWVFPVDMALIGDLRLTLQEIIETLQHKSLAGAKERTEALQERKCQEGFFESPEIYSDASPLLPQRIVREINQAVDPSTIITLDAGNNRLWMTHFFKSLQEGTFFCPGGIAGMGWGPSAALAAKLLYPQRGVLSVSGDGGFAMTLHILSTAVQYNLPVVFVVMNDSDLGMIRDIQKGKALFTQFAATDFARIAEALGCHGLRVEQPGQLTPAIKEALKGTMPTVIDVITSPTEPSPKIIA